MKKNSIVKQSHDLNMANYNLNPLTIDILHIYLAQIKKEDTEFKIFKFNISQLEKCLGKRIDTRTLDSLTTELTTVGIKIKLDNTKILKTTWCASALFDSENNTLELEISNRLKSYLLGLKKHFVLSDFQTISKLKGSYTKRIYLFISQFKSTGIFKISVEELRSRLDLTNKYPLYSDFKKRVLTASILNINLSLGLSLNLEEVKEGRSVKSLVFRFDKKKYIKIEKNNKEGVSAVEDWLSENIVIDTELL